MQDARTTLFQWALDRPGSLEDARAARQGPDAWMFGRYVVPVASLPRLLRELDPGEDPPLSVFGTPSVDRPSWEDARADDAAAMTRFEESAGDRTGIVSYEVRVPGYDGLAAYVADLDGFSSVDLFVELPWEGPLEDGLAVLAETELAFARAAPGGSFDQLARFIVEAANLDLPFKVGIGPNPKSVLGATALLMAEDLGPRGVADALRADPSEWMFEAGAISLREWRAELEDIEAARELLLAVEAA